MTDTIEATTNEQATKAETYTFRVLKADHDEYADTVEEYTQKGIKFDTVHDKNNKEKIVGIKRAPVTYDLPVFSINDFDPEFIADLIHTQVATVVRKDWVDNNLEPEFDKLTPAYIVDALTSKRTNAIDPEAVEALAVITEQFLEAHNINAATIRIIGEMVRGKFTKKVLNAYIAMRKQFGGVLGNVKQAMDTQDKEVQELLIPVHAQLVNNLARWERENPEGETPLSLSLV